jgi:hypothetical protein
MPSTYFFVLHENAVPKGNVEQKEILKEQLIPSWFFIVNNTYLRIYMEIFSMNFTMVCNQTVHFIFGGTKKSQPSKKARY